MIFGCVFWPVNRLLMRLQENGSRVWTSVVSRACGPRSVMARDVCLCRQMGRLDVAGVAQAAAQFEDLALGGVEGLPQLVDLVPVSLLERAQL